ncbi:MAG: LamG domain-containing protein [Candidatus Micrarchaeaceae archaeon]
MAIKNNLFIYLIIFSKSSKKGQLFTLTTLILFILMLSVLFSFVFIETQYYSQQQNIAISSGQLNILQSINTTAREFGSDSSKQALSVLSYYEYNASMRNDNFINNLTLYLHYLISNGTLPNVKSNSPSAAYLSNAMGNLTFSQYNQSLVNYYSSLGIQSVNETNFQISQSNPYTLSLNYIENIIFNQTGIPSKYTLPVNININLTGKYDLFYLQQGILRNINFANINNQTQVITGGYAVSGSNFGEQYGTVVLVTDNSCPSYTTAEESSMILVANQLSGLSSCYNNFEGVITNQSENFLTIPYLIYSQNTVLTNYFLNGTNIELYPKQLEALNIQNLINSVSNNYYFTSPFTSSYIQRASDIVNSSNYGIFNLPNNERTVATFNGLTDIVLSPSANLKVPVSNNGLSINLWVLPGNFEQNNAGLITTGAGCGINLLFATANKIQTTNNCGNFQTGSYQFTPNVWYDIGLTITSGSSPTLSLYVNGNQIVSSATFFSSGTSWTTMYLGSNLGSEFFNGSLSNIQIYNTSLSKPSMFLLYKRNLNGLPISNNGLVGWWSLNGNTKDLSGQNTITTSSTVAFTNKINGLPTINVTYFNGVNSYFSLPAEVFNYITSGSGNTYTSSFAIWFKSTSDGVILGQQNTQVGSSPSGFVPSIYLDTNGILRSSLFWHGSPSDQIVSTTPYNDGNWHLLVDTYSNGIETLYVDGKEIGTDSYPEQSYSSTYFYQLGTGYTSTWPSAQTGWFYFKGELANAQVYSTLLSPQQIQQMYNAGVSSGPISFSGLTGWWPLNDNFNDVINTEPLSYPNGVTFTSLNGSVITSQNDNLNSVKVPGIYCTNEFSCFDSNTGGVYLGNSPLVIGSKLQVAQFKTYSFITANIPLSGNFGLSMWVLPGKTTSEEYPVSFSGVNGITITTSSGINKFVLTDGVNTLSSTSINPMSWYYVAVTKNGNSYTLYLNNTEEGTSNMATIPINNFTLGSLFNLADGFNGSISNVQLYSNTLSTSQVQTLYNEGIYGSPLNSNVVAWFNLNGNCYNYTFSQYNCYLSRNVTYPYLYGNYSAPNYPIQTVENGYQALGYGTKP